VRRPEGIEEPLGGRRVPDDCQIIAIADQLNFVIYRGATFVSIRVRSSVGLEPVSGIRGFTKRNGPISKLCRHSSEGALENVARPKVW
jgi:hypothetical protein